MGHIASLVAIMIVSGVIGGIASYCASEIAPEETHPAIKRVALGIAAAFVVPLFLNMISSSILTDAQQTPIYYLVFAGFCIAAAFSSKAFLTSVSKSILDKVQRRQEDFQQRQEHVEQRQEELESDVEPIIAKETEPEPEERTAQSAAEKLDQGEVAVLRALADPRYTRRYIGGVAAQADLTEAQAASILSSLKERSLAGSKPGRRRELFWITARGRDYLSAFPEI